MTSRARRQLHELQEASVFHPKSRPIIIGPGRTPTPHCPRGLRTEWDVRMEAIERHDRERARLEAERLETGAPTTPGMEAASLLSM